MFILDDAAAGSYYYAFTGAGTGFFPWLIAPLWLNSLPYDEF